MALRVPEPFYASFASSLPPLAQPATGFPFPGVCVARSVPWEVIPSQGAVFTMSVKRTDLGLLEAPLGECGPGGEGSAWYAPELFDMAASASLDTEQNAFGSSHSSLVNDSGAFGGGGFGLHNPVGTLQGVAMPLAANFSLVIPQTPLEDLHEILYGQRRGVGIDKVDKVPVVALKTTTVVAGQPQSVVDASRGENNQREQSQRSSPVSDWRRPRNQSTIPSTATYSRQTFSDDFSTALFTDVPSEDFFEAQAATPSSSGNAALAPKWCWGGGGSALDKGKNILSPTSSSTPSRHQSQAGSIAVATGSRTSVSPSTLQKGRSMRDKSILSTPPTELPPITHTRRFMTSFDLPSYLGHVSELSDLSNANQEVPMDIDDTRTLQDTTGSDEKALDSFSAFEGTIPEDESVAVAERRRLKHRILNSGVSQLAHLTGSWGLLDYIHHKKKTPNFEALARVFLRMIEADMSHSVTFLRKILHQSAHLNSIARKSVSHSTEIESNSSKSYQPIRTLFQHVERVLESIQVVKVIHVGPSQEIINTVAAGSASPGSKKKTNNLSHTPTTNAANLPKDRSIFVTGEPFDPETVQKGGALLSTTFDDVDVNESAHRMFGRRSTTPWVLGTMGDAIALPLIGESLLLVVETYSAPVRALEDDALSTESSDDDHSALPTNRTNDTSRRSVTETAMNDEIIFPTGSPQHRSVSVLTPALLADIVTHLGDISTSDDKGNSPSSARLRLLGAVRNSVASLFADDPLQRGAMDASRRLSDTAGARLGGDVSANSAVPSSCRAPRVQLLRVDETSARPECTAESDYAFRHAQRKSHSKELQQLQRRREDLYSKGRRPSATSAERAEHLVVCRDLAYVADLEAIFSPALPPGITVPPPPGAINQKRSSSVTTAGEFSSTTPNRRRSSASSHAGSLAPDVLEDGPPDPVLDGTTLSLMARAQTWSVCFDIIRVEIPRLSSNGDRAEHRHRTFDSRERAFKSEKQKKEAELKRRRVIGASGSPSKGGKRVSILKTGTGAGEHASGKLPTRRRTLSNSGPMTTSTTHSKDDRSHAEVETYYCIEITLTSQEKLPLPINLSHVSKEGKTERKWRIPFIF